MEPQPDPKPAKKRRFRRSAPIAVAVAFSATVSEAVVATGPPPAAPAIANVAVPKALSPAGSVTL